MPLCFYAESTWSIMREYIIKSDVGAELTVVAIKIVRKV